jgi:hypothetical protein
MGRPRLLKSRKLSAVPLARYFTVAGSVLTVLLLIAGWSLPAAPESFPDRPEIVERAAIRITSEHKWPEKIVLDTSQPTFLPPPIEVAPIEQAVESLPDEVAYQTTVNAATKPNSDTRPIVANRRTARSKRERRSQSTHVARGRIHRKQITLATGDECCLSEWADRPVMSNVGSRKRAARRDLRIGWHFPQAD